MKTNRDLHNPVRPVVVFLALVVGIALPTRAQEARKLAFRAVHYDVNAQLAPVDQTLAARVKVELQAIEASRNLEVELHPNLKVTAVVGADGKPVPFERDRENPLIVKVTLPEAATAGQKVSLTFDYSGPLSSEENSPTKGVRLAYVAQGGSYLLLPARWFPLTGYPGNRYAGVFQLAVPENVAVVGTGQAAPPSMQPAARGAAAKVVYTFRAERPEPTGAFLAGNIQVVPVRAEGLTISVYVPAAAADTAVAYGQTVAKMVNVFSDQFGPLAQPNLALAQLPEGTLVSYAAPGLLLVAPRQWDPRVNYRLLAQLVARQWWGNEVVPATASDVWLADGLARYSEALYVEETAGKEGFQRALEDFAVGALMYEDAAPIAQAARLEPFSSDSRSVVMNKGAIIFHMLRSQMGDDAFRALLRDFHAKFAGKAARIEDFQKLAEEKVQQTFAAQGKTPPNLTAFFAQWLNSTGVPEFQTEYVIYRTPKGFRIVGKVRQDLETFRMPVEVKVETEGNPEFKTIEIVGTSSEFAIETFGRPKPGGIQLDPNNNLLKSSPKLRIRAAIARGEELAEAGRFYEAMQHYQQALDIQKNNSLAHFRLGEAAFYQKNYQAAANAFRDAVDGDLDLSYKWVEVWSHIYLGKIFDLTGQRERAVNEYNKAKSLNDDTGGAQAEAERYLNTPYKGETRPGSL